MKNLYIIGITLVLGLSLFGCNAQTPSDSVVDPTTTEINSVNEYKNMEYGFSLTFPETWGQVSEKIVASKDAPTNIVLTSEKDSEKTLSIMAVKLSEKNSAYISDAPFEFIAENETYAFYREVNFGLDIQEGQGADVSEARALESELKAIYETLEVI